MAAQIRPNRLEVTDRFPMLGFTIRTDGSPQGAEVALATDPSLFRPERKSARTWSNFYSSRAAGPLTIPRGEAVYVVPAEVLGRFVGQERLYVGLATTPGNNGAPPRVEVMPGEGSPYILLKGLTERSLRRVRLVPTRQDSAGGYGSNGAALEWAGDIASPGLVPASNGANGAAAATPAAQSVSFEYDDGFGAMPAPQAAPAYGSRLAASGPAAATPYAASPARALDLAALSVLAERLPVTAPTVTRLADWQAALVHGAVAALAGPIAPVVLSLHGAARAAGVSIGVGPAVGAGLGAGAGLGVGVVFGPDGGVGVYGAAEFQVGFIASISATAQITIVNGGIESFNGWGMAAAVSGGEGLVGGAAALFDMNGNFQGVSFQLGIGVGLTPIDFYVAIQRQVATQLAVAQAHLSHVARALPSARAIQALSTDIPLDPGNGGMSIGADALEVGDIILSTTAAPVSGLIRFGTGSQISHAMLFVGQGGQVVDATGDGVRLRPLADALADATLAVAFRYPALTDDQRMIIADRIAGHIGRPYNYWGIVRQARFQVHRAMCDILPGAAAEACRTFYGRVDLGTGNSSEFFCSQVVVAAYQEAGVPITDTPPIWSSPDDLVQLALNQHALAYVGHLKAPPYERRSSIWDSLGLQLAASRQSSPRISARPAALGVVRALDATRRPARLPQARVLGPVEKGIALGTLALVAPAVAAAVVAARAAANQFNVSIGIGPSVSAGFIEGGGAGVGIILAPGDQIGVYGQVDLRQGWIDSVSIELQCTVVHGGIEAFNGVSFAMAVEVDLGISVSAQALYDSSFNFQGVTFGFGAGGALEPIQVYMAVQSGVATQLAHAQAARAKGAHALTAGAFTINWDEVDQIPQPTNVSCWAAAAAMVVGWRDRMSLSPESIAQLSGRSTATGLDPTQVQQFAREMGLVFENPMCYTVEGFRRLLEANGPLWVAAAVPGLHAIVVTGMYSDGTTVYVRITDPWDRAVGTPGAAGKYMTTHATGSRYILTWDDFVREYEGAAMDFNSVNFQILHADGVFGRTANYGGTTPPGYAQALRAASARAASLPYHLARAHNEAARQVESGAAGAVRWTFERFDGMRRPTQSPIAGTPTDRMVRIDDWPLVHPPEGEMQLPLTVAWRYDAGAVGDVAIRPGDARSIPGWTLAVASEIAEGPDTPATCAITVRIRHVFGRTGRPDIVGVSELTLFGDGTYARQDRWEQAETNVA